MLYELHLTLCQLAGFLLTESTCALFEYLECRRRIGCVIAVAVHHVGLQQFIVFLSLIELFQYEFLELLQLFIGIASFFTHMC